METLLQALKLVGQGAVYLACLAWLAWRSERRRGEDAFHLVVVYAAGVWMVSMLVERLGVSSVLAVIAAAAPVFFLEEWWSNRKSFRPANDHSLTQILVLASLALTLYDWATSHTAVSLPIQSGDARSLALTSGVFAVLGILLLDRTRAGALLRLGVENRWAMEYWSRPLPQRSFLWLALGFLCWLPVLTIPLATTGILNSTILKDAAIAVLIARVGSTRGPIILLAIALTLAGLRTAAGFAVLSNAGPPMVEAMVFLCMLLWLRYRSSRTPWEKRDAH